jgi:hypothetical protein
LPSPTHATKPFRFCSTPAGAASNAFAAQKTFAVGATASFVAAEDFYGDGRPDLAVTNYDDKTALVLLNTTPAGASTPSFTTQQTFAAGIFPNALSAADVNGDSRPPTSPPLTKAAVRSRYS